MRTSEMIAMLEKNPKLKFISQNRYIAGVNERTGLFTWEHQEGTSGFNNNLRLLPSGGGKPDDWTLIHEPVPVWDAIKALTEGKTIKCVMNDDSCFRLDPERLGASGPEFHMSWLTAGRWFIEDPAHE